MPTNKNATIRYLAIDRCLRNPGRRFYIEDLVNACNEALLEINNKSKGISKRTVYSDLNFMEDSLGYNAPIERNWDGQKRYFRYSDTNFSISNQPLNQQEAEQLRESLQTLSRFKGLPQFNWVEEIQVRLDQNFKFTTEEKIISFDENPYLTGKEHIGELYNAIINKKVLNITYKSFKSDKTIVYQIHPYHLKQYNNRWFLWGLNHEYNNLTNIALDRIQLITPTKVEYKPNTDIDFNELFEDVVGVSINFDVQPQKVLLKVTSELLPYIKTKPIHGSQKIKEENEEYASVELYLQLNFEFESVLLSHGESVIVLSPSELKNKLQERIKKMFDNY
jgi:predicted DNA-binding transcriptional regulator YafY